MKIDKIKNQIKSDNPLQIELDKVFIRLEMLEDSIGEFARVIEHGAQNAEYKEALREWRNAVLKLTHGN